MEYLQTIVLIAFGFFVGYFCMPFILKWFGIAHIFVDKQYAEIKDELDKLHKKIDDLMSKF